MVVTDDGELWTWGYNQRGFIGNADSEDVLEPVNLTPYFQLGTGEKIADVSRSGNPSAEFTVAITNQGRVFTWGDNGAKLGIESSVDIYKPTDITDAFCSLDEGERVMSVSAANGSIAYSGHTIALTNKGRVLSWGSNSYGQLGNGATQSSYTPIDITNYFQLADDQINHVYATNNMTYATSKNGEVFYWGRNADSTIPVNISSLFPSGKLYDIGASELDDGSSAFLVDADAQLYRLILYTTGPRVENITNWFADNPLIALTGSNFTNVNNVYIDLNVDGTMQSNEQCTDLTVNSDTELTCNVPTDNSIATGDYTMYIETPYNYTTTTFRYENYGE